MLLRRSLPVLLACVLLPLAACSSQTPRADEATAALVTALGDHTLEGVPLTDPAQVDAFTEQIEPLARYDVEVETGKARYDGDEATVPLHWSWSVEGRQWEYETVAHLVLQEDEWQVRWTPETLFTDLAEGDRFEVSRTYPERAEILGARSSVLVTDRAVGRYGLDKTLIDADEVAGSAERIAEATGIDVETFVASAEAAGPKAFVEAVVVRPDDADDLVDPTFADIPGARVVDDSLPLAPTRTFARELLGTVGPATAEIIDASDGSVRAGDLVGRSGLQARYEEQLRGEAAVEIDVVSAAGCPKWPECDDDARTTVASWDAKPASPLRLTLDQELQIAAESILADAAGGDDAPASAIVAIRPSTGEILVAASGPGSGGLATATEGRYPPGSTFKVVSALALLRSGVTPDEVLPCPATIDVDGRSFKNYDGYPASAVGNISFRTGFAHSCNTNLIGARDRLEPDDLTSAASALGLGAEHDLGFPAYLGQVPATDGQTDAAAALIGQGRLLASPLAMATVAASVQAGGAVVPYLVEGTTANADVADPLTDAEAETLRDFMRAVVTEGTAPFLQSVPGEDVRAKTGTAEHGADPDAADPHAWMIAAQGDLAVAVFIDAGVAGAETAGPVMQAFLEAAHD